MRVYEWQDSTSLFERIAFRDDQITVIGWKTLSHLGSFRQASLDTQQWWYAPFAVGGTKIASPTEDGRVRIVDVRSNKQSFLDIGGSPGNVSAIGLSSDGDRIAVAFRR